MFKHSIKRSFSFTKLISLLNNSDIEVLCDPIEWINNSDNILLEHTSDFIAFEYESPGVYQAHYFFASGGKEAIRKLLEMQHEVFGSLGFKIIKGLTPVSNKAANWMNRRIGLKFIKTLDIPPEPMNLYIMTIIDYRAKQQSCATEASPLRNT